MMIADIREHLPGVPVLALTATATPEVVDDIQERLHFKEKNVFKKSFVRKNLAYIVRRTDDKLNMPLENGIFSSTICFLKSSSFI